MSNVYFGGCTITSKAQIFLFLKNSGTFHSKKFQKTLILAFEANSAFFSVF